MESQKTHNIHPVVQLNERINTVKERMSDAQEIFARKFNLIQEQINTMMERIEEDKVFQKEMALLRNQEMEQMQRDTDQFFKAEMVARKETEKNLMKVIDEKTMGLREMINKESKVRFSNIEDLEETLQRDFPLLQTQIKQQQQTREQNHS